jgi:chromatin remodeling complex protein RSC6
MAKRIQKKIVAEQQTVIEQVPTETQVETPVETSVVVPTETTVETPSVSINDMIKTALDELVIVKSQVKNLEGIIRNFKVLYKEEMKANKSLKRRKRSGEKQVITHGFVRQCQISHELADFLGVSRETTLSRPEVTKLISKYVNENKLWGSKANKEGENTINKTILKPDRKLLKILGEASIPYSKKNLDAGNGYSYFNLHSYLKRQNHFLAPVTVVA